MTILLPRFDVSSRIQAIAYANDSGLPEKPDATSPLPAAKHNLPAQTTPFVGRIREIAVVKQLLNVNRLLTLTGTGGTVSDGWRVTRPIEKTVPTAY